MNQTGESKGVPFTDAQIEAMAKAAFSEVGYEVGWTHADKPLWHRVIRAALAAGGLEPCAVPERASDEELAELMHDCINPSLPFAERCMAIRASATRQAAAVRARVEAPLLARVAELDKQLGEACAAARKEHGINDCSICGRETKNTGPCMVCLSETHRAELEAVKAERDTAGDMVAGLDETIQALRAELAALRHRRVPVKVRWSVTAAELKKAVLEAWNNSETYQFCLDYLADHAVIDVPAGVPSVEELGGVVAEKMGQPMIDRSEHLQRLLTNTATAIRDRVLAGVATATPTPAPTDEQVEALARVLCDNWRDNDGGGIHNGTYDRGSCREEWNNCARAAFAHFGTVPGVDPDAWKTPLRVEDASGDAITTRGAGEFSILVECDEDGVSLTPEKAKQVSLHLASYAAAHGCPVDLRTHKIGLPMGDYELPEPPASDPGPAPIAPADTLEKLADVWDEAFSQAFREGVDARIAAVAAILRAAKARVDAVPSDLYHEWNKAVRMEIGSWQVVLDFCNSRITFGVELSPAPIWSGPTRAQAEAKWLDLRSRDEEECKGGWRYTAQDFRDYVLGRLPETAGAGWEFATLDEYRDMRAKVTKGSDWTEQIKSEYDWLRSRIRPAACKECEIASQSISDLQLELDHVKTNLAECEHRIDVARAALEGRQDEQG